MLGSLAHGLARLGADSRPVSCALAVELDLPRDDVVVSRPEPQLDDLRVREPGQPLVVLLGRERPPLLREQLLQDRAQQRLVVRDRAVEVEKQGANRQEAESRIAAVQPEAIAARVWPGREVELEPLGGGITNRNFKVTVGGESFVLRIGGKDTALLGIDRQAEHAATSVAAALEIGPEVVAFVEPEGSLVTRFVAGSPLPMEEMRRTETLRHVAEMLRSLHDGPSFPAQFDSFRVVEAYLATAASRGVATPREYERAKQTADEIERTRGPQRRAPLPQRPAQRELHPRRVKRFGSSTGSTPAWATASSTSPTSRSTTS